MCSVIELCVLESIEESLSFFSSSCAHIHIHVDIGILH